MAEELLINIDIKGEENLTNVDKKLDEVTKSGGKATNALAQLRKEMKDAKSDMLKYEEGTDGYNNAMKRAALSADKMRDINDKVIASQRDVGIVAKNVAGSVAGLAAGFATAQGVISLFGVESESTTKAILKLQQVLTITQGISNFVDAFDSMKDLYGAIKLRLSETSAAKSVDTAITNENTAAVLANNAANDASKKSIDSVSKSTHNLGSEASLLGANLVGNQQISNKLDESLDKVSKTISKYREEDIVSMKEVTNANGKLIRSYEIIPGAKKNIKESTDKLTDSTEKNTISIKSNIVAMVKNIAVMGLYAIAIGAVMYVITTLIKKMTEIPDNIKIKIGIESDAINQTKSLREDILKFEKDYDKARSEGDYRAIKRLDDLAKKQYGLSQAQINTINHTKDGWEDFFKGYLKMAEDTYYNEALIKQKVELEMQIEVAKVQADAFKKSGKLRQDEIDVVEKYAKQTGLSVRTIQDIFGVGIKQDLLDVTRSINDNQAKLKELEKIKAKTNANYFNQKTIDTTENITKTVKEKVVAQPSNIDYRKYSNFGQPDVSGLEDFYKKSSDLNSKLLNDNLTKMGNDELDELKKLYDKGKLTTDEYLKEKLDIITSYELAGVDLTQTAYNAQAEIVEKAEAQKREAIQKTIATIEESLNTATSVVDAISALNQNEVDSVNKKYTLTKEKNDQAYYDEVERINKSTMNQEEKDKALTDLDNQRLKAEEKNEEVRYKALQKNFEMQKALDIAQVWINAASGVVGIWSRAHEGGLFGGPIIAGIQSAALVALATAQTVAISKQRMDRPIKTSGAASSAKSSTSTSESMNAAKLNPTKTSLTSKEENINMMGGNKTTQAVVKVSDINKVQNTVAVRNNNTTF